MSTWTTEDREEAEKIMNNEPALKGEPVTWMSSQTDEDGDTLTMFSTYNDPLNAKQIPLYTQDQLEEARKLGMQQERALWNLSASTQEIMDTHPAELTDEEIQELALSNEFWISEDCTIFDWHKFARAILRKAQGK